MLQVLDEGSILTFHISLALRPVGYRGLLLYSQLAACFSQELVDELTSIVACKEFRWTKEADKVFKAFSNSLGCLVSQFVGPDESREDVFENEHIFETKAWLCEGDKVAHYVIEHARGDNGL